MNKINGAEFEEIMDRYGFKEPKPVVDKRKFRVSLAGKEAIMTYPEFIDFSREISTTGMMPIAEEIEDTGKCDSWAELIRVVKHAWEYGIHSNDMTLGEIEEDISFALDKFANSQGLPKINWEEDDDYLDLYDQEQHRVAADARGCK